MIRRSWISTCILALAAATAFGQAPAQFANQVKGEPTPAQPRLLSQRISGQRISGSMTEESEEAAPPQPVQRTNAAGSWGTLANRQTENGLRQFTPRHLRAGGTVANVSFNETIEAPRVARVISRGMPTPGGVAPMPGGYVGEEFIQPGGCSDCNQGCASCGDMGCASCGEIGCATCGDISCASCGCEDCAMGPGCGMEPNCGCGGGGRMGRFGRREFNDCPFPTPWCRWRDLEIGVGLHAFKGAMNLGADGSFGVHQTANYGFLAPCFPAGVSGQLGFQTTQSNFYGASFTNDSRQQLFLTGGFFRRADWGLQGGVVYDYMIDDWQINTRLSQIRAELSWAYPSGYDIGLWGTRHLDQDVNVAQFSFVPRGFAQNQAFAWRTSDVYAAFVRKRTKALAEGRFMMGFTDQSKFLLGADYSLPVTQCMGLGASAIFLLPDASRGDFRGVQDEEWNLAFNVIYYPGGWARVRKSYNRPLLPVAGNDNFMLTRLSP